MGIGRERRRRVGTSSAAPSGRLSKGQELTLFVVMMAVLVALIIYGLRA
ncbi:MAG: hypothetical protein ABWX73_13630 [Marmoricola sp.]